MRPTRRKFKTEHQHLRYLWRMPATRSWERAYEDGKCDATRSAFWEAKPTEELYDTEADPWEVHNLARSPEHAAILERLRAANRAHLLAIRKHDHYAREAAEWTLARLRR